MAAACTQKRKGCTRGGGGGKNSLKFIDDGGIALVKPGTGSGGYVSD